MTDQSHFYVVFYSECPYCLETAYKETLSMLFKDRYDAANQLNLLLEKYQGKDVIVYGIPRGGVVVASEIAKFLHAPLDLIFAHKVGYPGQPEYAIAAVSESGYLVETSRHLPWIEKSWLEDQKQHQIDEIKKKKRKYIKEKSEISLKDKTAILVDDGIATGLTMQAAIKELQHRHPKKIVVAVPISIKSTANLIKTMVDDYVGIEIENENFLGAVGAYYDHFNQVEDDEVIKILSQMSI